MQQRVLQSPEVWNVLGAWAAIIDMGLKEQTALFCSLGGFRCRLGGFLQAALTAAASGLGKSGRGGFGIALTGVADDMHTLQTGALDIVDSLAGAGYQKTSCLAPAGNAGTPWIYWSFHSSYTISV